MVEQNKKIDWSKVDWDKLGKEIGEKMVESYRQDHLLFRAWLRYTLFTPTYLKIWHKITFKKTPKYENR